MNRESFLPFYSARHLLIFLVLLHCLGLPVQWWIVVVRVGIFVLFLTLGQSTQSLSINYHVSWSIVLFILFIYIFCGHTHSIGLFPGPELNPARALTRIAAAAMPDPSTRCAGLGIQPVSTETSLDLKVPYHGWNPCFAFYRRLLWNLVKLLLFLVLISITCFLCVNWHDHVASSLACEYGGSTWFIFARWTSLVFPR